MLQTVVCIFIVLFSIIAVGVPFRWVIGGRKTLDEVAWIQAPFLGVGVIILVLQNLVYLDVTIRQSTPFLWMGVLVLWIWFYRSKELSASLPNCPALVFAAALAVYLAQGIGLLLVGAKYYMGRGFNDQFNYVALAQFLADDPYSTSVVEVATRPYLIKTMTLKLDRIGQSVLQGFFHVSSFSDAKTLFEPTILLSPTLIVLAVYILSCNFGLPKWQALPTGIAAGMLPGVTMIHLESFLSQALTIPFLLIWPGIINELCEQPDWHRLGVAAILFTATTSTYTEYWIILLAIASLMIGITAVYQRRIWSLLGCYTALVVSVFGLNPGFAPAIFTIFRRLDAAVLQSLYPWAFKIEGLGRVWLGDLAEQTQVALQSVVRTYGLAATAIAYYGLTSTCLASLSFDDMHSGYPDRQSSFAFSVGVLAISLLPIAIAFKDNQHPYQFYKALLSVSPLLVIGLSLFSKILRSILVRTIVHANQRWLLQLRNVSTLLSMGIILTMSALGTLYMDLRSTKSDPMPRHLAYYMLKPSIRQMQDKLEEIHGYKLFACWNDTTLSPYVNLYVNAWVSYFARRNQVWMGNPRINSTDPENFPPLPSIIDSNMSRDNLLILSSKDCGNLASQLDASELVASNEAYQLWRPVSSTWATIVNIENSNGLGHLEGEPFMWLGQGNTTVDILSGRSGTIRMTATYFAGPSTPNLSRYTLRINTETGYQQQVVLHTGKQEFTFPVHAGKNRITLHTLDQPTVTSLPGGETRSLILGIQNLSVALEAK